MTNNDQWSLTIDPSIAASFKAEVGLLLASYLELHMISTWTYLTASLEFTVSCMYLYVLYIVCMVPGTWCELVAFEMTSQQVKYLLRVRIVIRRKFIQDHLEPTIASKLLAQLTQFFEKFFFSRLYNWNLSSYLLHTKDSFKDPECYLVVFVGLNENNGACCRCVN